MATHVTVTVQVLVDAFLRDDYDLEEDTFVAEGHVEDAGGEKSSHLEKLDEEFIKRKLGRDLKLEGDSLVKKYERATHKNLTQSVKSFFNNKIKEAGGDPDVFWPEFRDTMDKAMEDTGLCDTTKILATLLVTVKGLSYLGGAVRNFTMRYIEERKLDEDFKHWDQRKHPSLD